MLQIIVEVFVGVAQTPVGHNNDLFDVTWHIVQPMIG